MPFSVEKAAKGRKNDVSSGCTSERTLCSDSVIKEEYSKDSKSGRPSGVINSVVSPGETQIRSISNLLPHKNTSKHEHLMSVPCHSEILTEDRGDQLHPSNEKVCDSKVFEAITNVSHISKMRKS
jgi:hypothetical protein